MWRSPTFPLRRERCPASSKAGGVRALFAPCAPWLEIGPKSGDSAAVRMRLDVPAFVDAALGPLRRSQAHVRPTAATLKWAVDASLPNAAGHAAGVTKAQLASARAALKAALDARAASSAGGGGGGGGEEGSDGGEGATFDLDGDDAFIILQLPPGAESCQTPA